MSYDDDDAMKDAYYASLEEEFKEGRAREAAKSYLGRYGDSVDQRVLASTAEAKSLVQNGYCGPALCAAAVAVELMIRFMLLRPLVQGAFLSDEWAEILTTRIVSGETARDRELVPAVLRQWGLDITKVRGADSGVRVWEFTVSRLFSDRNNYLHRYDPVTVEVAAQAVECAESFRRDIVSAIAKQIGFSLEATGRWSKIVYPREVRGSAVIGHYEEEFDSADAFSRPKT